MGLTEEKEKEGKEQEKDQDSAETDEAFEAMLDSLFNSVSMQPMQDTKEDEGGDTAAKSPTGETSDISKNTPDILKQTPPVTAKDKASGTEATGEGKATGADTKDEGKATETDTTDGGKDVDDSDDDVDNSEEDLEETEKTASGTVPPPAVSKKPAVEKDGKGTGEENKVQPKAERKGDLINNIVADIGLQTQEDEPAAKEGEKEDPNRAFDTLADLAEIPSEDWKKTDAALKDGAELKALRDRMVKARKGNLYKAVIYAKMLEKGERPAAKAKELETEGQGGGRPGRFSRFMNSSDFDKLGKIGKITGAVNGLAALDSTYADGTIKSVVALVTDFIVLVNSVRGIFNKIKNFKSSNKSARKKIFAVIGIVSDFAMAVSKAASMAKTIMGWTGTASKLAKTKVGNISVFAGLAGQVTGMAGVINTLQEMDAGIRALKKDQAEEGKKVAEIMNHPLNVLAQDGESKKRVKPDRELVLEVLRREDLSEEEKAVLASYLGRERTIAKKKLLLANTGMGLVTSAFGIGTSIAGGVSGVRSQKKLAKGEEDDPDDPATKANTIMGGINNSSILLSTAGMHFAKKGVNNSGPGEETSGAIREGLWGALHSLGSDDKNGLRKVAAALNPDTATKEDETKAKTVLDKYDAAEKQFSGSGVMYSKLFEANDIDVFKNALIAGL